MMEPEVKGVILTVIATLIIIMPFIWYIIFKIWLHRTEIFIKTRHSKLLLTTLCLLAFDITVLEPIWFIIVELETVKSIKTVLTAIYSNYQFLIFGLIYFRLYLMYYDYKYSLQIRAIKWENMFNANHNNSWFTKHRQTFGSTKWLQKPCIFIAILYIILNILSFVINNLYPLHEILVALYIFLCGVCSLYVATQIESHDDSFYIKQECQYTAIIALCGLFLFITLHFIDGAYNDNIIIHLFSICTFIITLYAIFCISSIYVLRKNGYYILKLTNDKNENYESAKGLDFAQSINSGSSYGDNPDFCSSDGESTDTNMSHISHVSHASHLALSDDSSSAQLPLEWIDVVARKSGFVLFMNHLISEYSHENLIFISEVIQWKIWFKRKLNTETDIATPIKFGYTLKLPSSLPISSILTESVEDSRNEGFVRAKLLFLKYIKRDRALYEVNISDTQRCILESCFEINGDSMNEMGLLQIYDEALKDVEWLLKDGFTRFRFTEKFERYWRRKKTLSDRIGALFSISNSKQNVLQ